MKYIKKFFENKEDYMRGNYAPLYHITNVKYAENILNNNSLNVSSIAAEMPVKHDSKYILSLTRNKKMINIDNRTKDIQFAIDTNKLKNTHKTKAYDFYTTRIKSHFGKFTKSDPNRTDPFEYEDITFENIKPLSKYLLYINILTETTLNNKIFMENIKSYCRMYKIELRHKDKKIII